MLGLGLIIWMRRCRDSLSSFWRRGMLMRIWVRSTPFHVFFQGSWLIEGFVAMFIPLYCEYKEQKVSLFCSAAQQDPC